jgi:hypothetical protein
MPHRDLADYGRHVPRCPVEGVDIPTDIIELREEGMTRSDLAWLTGLDPEGTWHSINDRTRKVTS